MMPPSAPGTAPLTNNKLFSASTFTTFKFKIVFCVVSHMTRHTGSGKNARRIRRGSYTAWCPMEHASVGIATASETMAANNTLKTFALCSPGHIHPSHILHVFHRQSLPHLKGASVFNANFF